MLLSPPHHAVHEPAENVQPAPAQELLDSRVAFLVLRARLDHDDAEAGGVDVLQHKRLCALHLRHGGFRRWDGALRLRREAESAMTRRWRAALAWPALHCAYSIGRPVGLAHVPRGRVTQ